MSGKASHTPGPWKFAYGGVFGPDGSKLLVNGVAMPCGNHPQDAEATANARLLAASPDLLAACEALPLDSEFSDAADFKDHAREFLAAMELARIAVAKAKGVPTPSL